MTLENTIYCTTATYCNLLQIAVHRKGVQLHTAKSPLMGGAFALQ